MARDLQHKRTEIFQRDKRATCRPAKLENREMKEGQMKFKHGQWEIKSNIKSSMALEYITSEINRDSLIVYANTKHIESRGDVVTHGILTVTLSSPIPDVIRVSAVHHKGVKKKGPYPDMEDCHNTDVEVKEEKEAVMFRAGKLTARIVKVPFAWSIEFIDNETGELLTCTDTKSLGYMVDTDTGKCYMTDQLALENGELVYGLGERFGPIVRNGQCVDMWNEDGGTGSDLSYKNIPFYMTSRKYGVYVESTGKVSFEVASESVERVRFSVEGEELTYDVFCGDDPKDVMEKYTRLMGRPALPPAWSFGMWMSSCYKTDFDEHSIVENVDRMVQMGIPLSTYHLDFFWSREYKVTNFLWNDQYFKDPEGFIKNMHDRGVRVNLWLHPYIPQRSEIFEEAREKGYFIKKSNGDVWQTDNWQAGMAIVDFTNPDAYQWFQSKVRGLLEKYADSVAADFGEKIPTEDDVFYDGSDPVKMHNYYSYLYNKCVFEVTQQVKGEKKACCFFRSGSAGSQKYPCHWGGDPDATYKSMAAALRAGISAAVSGFCFWSHDVTGFGGKATPDLYKRWCAFGMFLTHTRLHGESFPKEPWNYDEESCSVLARFSKVKCALMPYIYGQAVLAHESGIPVFRPVFFEFPEDPSVRYLDAQYMFGERMMVAPVMNEHGRVQYYLPEGIWTNYLTGARVEGGRWIQETYDYFSLPVMVRPDSIIVTGYEDEKADYDFEENPIIGLYEISDGAKITAKIPDKNGEYVSEAEAKREGTTITVQMKGKTSGYRIFISNRKVKSVDNGELIGSQGGSMIKADGDKAVIRIED